MRYLIVGAVPNPVGGVSIHVFRLCNSLAQIGVEVALLDVSRNDGGGFRGWLKSHGVLRFRVSQGLRLLCWVVFHREPLTINLNVNSPLLCFAFIGLSRFRRDVKVILTVHSFRRTQGQFRRRQLHLAMACSFCQEVIVTNATIRDDLLELGVDAKSIHVLPTFIPPSLFEKTMSVAPDICSYLTKHRFSIVGNAYKLEFFNGNDLYGLDMCIELIRQLRQMSLDACLLFAIPQIGNELYYQQCVSKIEGLGLQSCIKLITYEVSLVSIVKLADLFVRPTNTDGDAISIREALGLGVPVVASDCVVRPHGVIQFPSRNQAAFTDAVLEVLNVRRSLGRDDFGNHINDSQCYVDNILSLSKKCSS